VNGLGDFAEVHVQKNLDVAMVEHALEERRIAGDRHELIVVGKVPVVRVQPRWDASRNRRVELGRVETPLLARVAPEELFVQLAADFADYSILGGARPADRLCACAEEVRELFRCQRQTVHLIHGIEVDRKRYELAVDLSEHVMLVGPPLRELRQVFEDSSG
jgi:hypothetical protein